MQRQHMLQADIDMLGLFYSKLMHVVSCCLLVAGAAIHYA